MAAMVARGSSQLPSSVSVQEKGSRNKRKFHSDLPVGDANKLAPLQSECSSYELDKSDNTQAPGQQGPLDLCGFHQDQNDGSKLEHGSSSDFGGDGPKDDLEAEESRDVDWSEITETQLEELVLNTLDTIYKSAIKRIAAYGYGEDLAVKAVLRSGLYYGCKDAVSNIVDNALAFLRTGQEIDSSKELIFMDLQQLERYILAEMVCVLRQVRPFFSTGDAMWCLLICDMNMSHACAMDGDVFSNNFGSSDVGGSSSVSDVSDINSDTNSSVQSGPEVSIPRPSKPNKLIPNLPAPRFSSSGNAPNLEKESSVSSAGCAEESSSLGEEHLLTVSRSSACRSSGLEDKFVGGRKVHMNSSKRESILRQKSIHLEKTYRAYGSRAALKSGKLSGLTSFFMDKKCKPVAEAAVSISNLKNASLKISKAVGVGASVTDGIANAVANAGPTADLEFSTKTIGNPSALSVANTELSLSLPPKANVASKPSTNVETTVNDAGVSSDKIIGQLVPDDKKDETLVKLVRRLQELQTQVQEWTEWGQQKVMQAARRLSKDKGELTTLRQEKEEVARLKKEKQTLEENTMKKLSEMENALLKASGQVDRANATVRRLEVENSQLRQEMEAAKLQAAESAASCQEVSRREKKTLKKYESWERQKSLFREELVTEKHKLSQLQQQLEQAKEYHSQLEVRWKQEGKMKEEALMQANSERKEREEIEAAAKLKEDTIRSKAETDFQRYRDDIQRLESEISKLRLKTDSSKIAALRWSIDGSYASRLVDARSNPAFKETNVHDISYMFDILDLGIGRERECVMCLTEEMSVVFLPCAHQVVCTKCNELHDKQGMKDCPSCRTPIQQRIHVRSADS